MACTHKRIRCTNCEFFCMDCGAKVEAPAPAPKVEPAKKKGAKAK
jgi:DNA-directed RNA polymerase subunit RPC12/RpoP